MSGSNSPDLDADFAPMRSSAVYTVEIDGEAVLLDERANRLHHLNHTAALLWVCFDGDTPLTQLASEISEELRLPYEAVLADSIRVAHALAGEGLLAGIPPDGADAV